MPPEAHRQPAPERALDVPAAQLEGVFRGLPAWLAEVALPFSIVLYLGLEGGGYGVIARSEVGIVLWWLVLLGVAVGVLPRARLGRATWIALALLGSFAAWTALELLWTESSERTMQELGRVAMYLGVLAVAVCVPRAGSARRIVGSVAAAIAVLGGLALLSRLEPSWFPADEAAQLISFAENRLNYPLNYWNALAALMAMGLPLLLAATLYARSIAVQAIAAAAVPAMALTAFYTLSRGGAVEIAIGILAVFALVLGRAWMLPTLAATGAGSAVLIGAATQRDELENGLGNQAALAQGDEMLIMALVVCAGVGLVQAGIGLIRRYELGPRIGVLRVGRRAATAAVAAVVIAAIVALGVSGSLSDAWESFKSPEGTAKEQTARFASASGEGRYQYWRSAVDSAGAEPLTGSGPGTFEFWWAREGDRKGFVANAHSLYFETLAESGVLGLLLLIAFLGVVLIAAFARVLAEWGTERTVLGGALAAGVVACVAFGIDWVWELAVIPAAFMLLVGSLLIGSREEAGDGRGLRPGVRIAVAITALAAIVAIGIPLATTSSVRASQEKVRAAEIGGALVEARDAAKVQPAAASPQLQQALVLELDGDLDRAATAARAATEKESTNWRTWLTLSRIEARRGNAEEAVAAYDRARALNPRSSLFEE